MTLTIQQTQQLVQEHTAFIYSIQAGQQSLLNVIATGTTLFNDTNYAQTFGLTPAYTTYLTTCQTLINQLMAAWPVEPSISW